MITDFSVCPYARPAVVPGGPREGWLLRLTDVEGRVGWGDAAPWPGFGPPGVDIPATLTVLGAAALAGEVPPLAGLIGYHPAAVHAFALAWADLVAQRRHCPLAALWAHPPAKSVRTHVLVAGPADAAAAVADGATTLKIKLGRRPLAEDLDRVARVRAVAPDAALRLDINGRWHLAQAEAAFDALSAHDPSFVEQPLAAADFAGHARLGARFEVPIALDESVLVDADAAIEVASVVVVKPMFHGAIEATLELAARARGRGKSVCLTHALGSAIERAGAVHLAAALADGAVHGVGPPSRGDRLPVPTGPGLGVSP